MSYFSYANLLLLAKDQVEIDGDEDAVAKKSTRAPKKTTTNATNRRKGKHATSECSDSSKKNRKPVARDAKSQIRKQGDDLIKSIDEIKTGM